MVTIWFVIFTVLVILIITLILHIKAIRKVRQKLEVSKQEIEDTCEALRDLQKQLREVAYYDPLTQMPNKKALQEDFELNKEDCSKAKKAVMFIDADNFKLINDTLGHSIGDKFLIQIAKRLQEFESDSIKTYRMGGDEFLLLISSIQGEHEIIKIADKIMGSFTEGFLVEEILIHTTVSAGITIYPDHGETSEALIMRADIAMYKAKEKGKDKYVFYNNDMNQEIRERALIGKHLRTAIQNQEFFLNYQPQYDFKTKKIVAFEALIRWNNEELGWVSPLKFIGIAEDSRSIIPIGRWVLETACKFLSQIHQLGYTDYTMAVNISAVQVVQEDFVETVLQILEENKIEAKHLEVEMTETMLIENFNLVVNKLEELRKHGVTVALDDFGTGYSSLNYLNQLPIDTLKIDKSFVDTISIFGEEKTIINVLIALGHGMGIKVIAEGVETEEEFAYLKKYGCDYMQGYLLSRPLSADNIIKLLKSFY